MKKILIILLIASTEVLAQDLDSLITAGFQEWIISKDGKKVGDGVCESFVVEFLNTINPSWKNDWARNGEIRYGEKISRKDLRPGDIIVFEKPYKNGGDSHIGIFAGYVDDESETPVLAHQNTKQTLKQSVVVLDNLTYIEERFKKVTYFRPILDK